ncbi:Glycosyl transferases group 1 [Crateriforma conspicua]|uniref:Glycosyl transferases group 1 n=1 Tax=Crateriforma conspicua TaxID=2527996 RepID=A0A5C6FX89_9PLAN|nr:glycosyltransferase [Crateriforma conspicua]TWU67006.1 Glycosyl transferases group 1 [Crateriforma conspicua]
MEKIVIHATNVTGLGACKVVDSILKSIDAMESKNWEICCLLPSTGPISDFAPRSEQVTVQRVARRLPKSISRIVEMLWPVSVTRHKPDWVLVLGDIPLRTRIPQLVFIQQAHLISPSINANSSPSWRYRVMRAIARLNASCAKVVVCQTDAMAGDLIQTYPQWSIPNRVKVIRQPVPKGFRSRRPETTRDANSRLKLFYPAAPYPHKNHGLFRELSESSIGEYVEKFVLTVSRSDVCLPEKVFHCIGPINYSQCLEEYSRCDALVFPSLIESYGLPLVEAMAMQKPILAADLPYARTLCGSEAVYFDPRSARSLYDGVKRLKAKLDSGWKPQWHGQLSLLPDSWEEVVKTLLGFLSLDE